MKNRKGVSLIWVIIALVFVSIMTISISTIAQSNILQAKRQDNIIQAYYIARSGAEITYEALITSSPSLLLPFTHPSNSTNTHKITDSIVIGEGTADIVVTSYNIDTVKRIRIESIGELNNVTKTIILEFDATSKANIRWTY